jgi:hypothetical protein
MGFDITWFHRSDHDANSIRTDKVDSYKSLLHHIELTLKQIWTNIEVQIEICPFWTTTYELPGIT